MEKAYHFTGYTIKNSKHECNISNDYITSSNVKIGLSIFMRVAYLNANEKLIVLHRYAFS